MLTPLQCLFIQFQFIFDFPTFSLTGSSKNTPALIDCLLLFFCMLLFSLLLPWPPPPPARHGPRAAPPPNPPRPRPPCHRPPRWPPWGVRCSCSAQASPCAASSTAGTPARRRLSAAAALLAAVRAWRGLLGAAAWALSAALTDMFARRVAAVAPGPAAATLVWALAGATVAGGFCCLFVHGRGGADPDHVGGGRDARPA